MSAIVFGSLNMDLVSRVPRLPQAGETILGTDFIVTPGGKGANQAVALAKLGVPTQMIGRVGDDDFGRSLVQSLSQLAIDTQHILIDPTTHSGVAVITVTATGENQIVGVFGANGCVDDRDVDRLRPLLVDANILLLQLEIPIAAVQAAAQVAQAAGVKVILDPAPVQQPDLTVLYPHIDILVPNEIEASQLVGFAVNNVATAKQAADYLQAQGVPIVVIKLGAAGAYVQSHSQAAFVPGFVVDAIDTVACGDAFAGGLTAGLIANLDLIEAVGWGNAAGALAATKLGAQVAMPTQEAFEAFLRDRQVDTLNQPSKQR
jgi:ribokinase